MSLGEVLTLTYRDHELHLSMNPPLQKHCQRYPTGYLQSYIQLSINIALNKRDLKSHLPPLSLPIIYRSLTLGQHKVIPMSKYKGLTNRHLTTPSLPILTLPFTRASFPWEPFEVPEKYKGGYFEDFKDLRGWRETELERSAVLGTKRMFHSTSRVASSNIGSSKKEGSRVLVSPCWLEYCVMSTESAGTQRKKTYVEC